MRVRHTYWLSRLFLSFSNETGELLFSRLYFPFFFYLFQSPYHTLIELYLLLSLFRWWRLNVIYLLFPHPIVLSGRNLIFWALSAPDESLCGICAFVVLLTRAATYKTRNSRLIKSIYAYYVFILFYSFIVFL